MKTMMSHSDLDIEILERLCLMTDDGGLSDDQALWGLGLKGTNFEQWLKDHPVKEGK